MQAIRLVTTMFVMLKEVAGPPSPPLAVKLTPTAKGRGLRENVLEFSYSNVATPKARVPVYAARTLNARHEKPGSARTLNATHENPGSALSLRESTFTKSSLAAAAGGKGA